MTWATSRRRCFNWSTGTSNGFSAFLLAQNATWRSRESDVTRGREALQHHFMPSARPKLSIVRGREFDVRRFPLALRKYFLPSGHHIKRLGRVRKSDISRGRCEIVGRGPKNDISSGRSPLRTIIFSFCSDKNICRGRNTDDSRGRLEHRTYFLPFARHKKRLGRSRKRFFKGRLTLRTQFLPSVRSKIRLSRSRERDKFQDGSANSFYATWTSQNAMCGRSKKICFLGFPAVANSISAPCWAKM